MDQTFNSNPGKVSPPGLVKAIAVIFYLESIVFVVGGVLMMLMGSLFIKLFLGLVGLNLIAGLGILPGIIVLALGIFAFIIGRGLWDGKKWARKAAIVINGIYLLFGIFGLVSGGGTNYISLLLNIAIVLYLSLSKEVKNAF